jgi:hypothetical protein
MNLGKSFTITLSMGALAVIVGLTVTGDFVRPWVGYYNPGLGYTFVDVGFGAFIVFIFIDRLLLRERREYWKEVGAKARNLVKTELMGIVADVLSVTMVSRPSFAPVDATNEELLQLEKEATLKGMETQANDLQVLRDSVSEDFLDGKYGEIFSTRAKRLADLQLRYWSNFLEPKLVALMIDIEQLLDILDTHIKIVAKDREQERATTSSELSKRLAAMYVEEVYKDLQNLMKKLLAGIQENLIEML